MVVAEIPLWAVHPSGSTTAAASSNKNKLQARAAHSLSLLSAKKKNQTAIYSVDLKDNIWATGGGDGMVRLWSFNALFHKNVGGRYDEDRYHSTTSAAVTSDGEEDSSGSESDDQRARTTATHTLSPDVIRHRRGSNGETISSPNTRPKPPPEASRQEPASPSHTSANSHRSVATLNTGASSVLCVRFDPNAMRLACANDDGSVAVYGSNENDPTQWIRLHWLRAHNLDAVGLAWPRQVPEQDYLVSCSLDRHTPIVVWDLKTSSAIKVLGKTEHPTNVKGISLDPAGSFLASSSDDGTICLWRTHDDWSLERTMMVNKSNTNALLSQSLFGRLDWATDGSFVCATHATVQNKPVGRTLSREENGPTADLVGHKQTVVVAASARQLVYPKTSSADDASSSPPAILVALGDAQGFLTVWSTQQARPIFKLQCSESRSAITDLTWRETTLIVALLEGHVVALRFTPNELGTLLTPEQQAQVFEERYGDSTIQSTANNTGGGPLSEQAFYMDDDDAPAPDSADEDVDMEQPEEAPPPPLPLSPPKQKTTTTKSGKKRIQPVLLPAGNAVATKKSKAPPVKPAAAPKDPMQVALDAAKVAAEASPRRKKNAAPTATTAPTANAPVNATVTATAAILIPPPNHQVHSTPLEALETDILSDEDTSIVAEFRNQRNHAQLSIIRQGQATWKHLIVGTFATCLSASRQWLVVGTLEGSLHVLTTSHSLGWSCGVGHLAFPPVILGNSIVSVQLKSTDDMTQLLSLTSEGNFWVHEVLGNGRLGLSFKGTVQPVLSSTSTAEQPAKVSRFQLTDSGRLLLLLSTPKAAAGGSLQVFVYDTMGEIWMRMADSRYIVSDFFSILPSKRKAPLEGMQNLVRMGAHHAEKEIVAANAPALITRSHCEDRLACSVALDSPVEFKTWLGRYVKILAGTDSHVRLLIDALRSCEPDGDDETVGWLGTGAHQLKLDANELLKTVVLPEMRKHTSLQRLTNEINAEFNAL